LCFVLYIRRARLHPRISAYTSGSGDDACFSLALTNYILRSAGVHAMLDTRLGPRTLQLRQCFILGLGSNSCLTTSAQSPQIVMLRLALGEAALASNLLAVPEEDVREGKHGHGEKCQQRRCPLVAQLLIHLVPKQRKRRCEYMSASARDTGMEAKQWRCCVRRGQPWLMASRAAGLDLPAKRQRTNALAASALAAYKG